MSATPRRLDRNAVKFNHGVTIILLIAGFILDTWIPVAAAAVAQLLGAAAAPFAPYKLIYEHIVIPNGWIKPRLIPDHPEPHRFAVLVGGLFDTAGILALWAGAPLLGWSLVWVVIVLANLNVWISFCMGCWMYYQFNRLGVPGFTQAPVR
jgi:hypothetical protein